MSWVCVFYIFGRDGMDGRMDSSGKMGRGAMLMLVRQQRDRARVLASDMECGLHIGLSSM